MARLNTRISATPVTSRASTTDSLYRDPTPAGRAIGASSSTARQSSYSVLSPDLSQNSDKENDTPESREETPQPRGKRQQMASARTQRLPTPESGSSSNPNKRRRTGDHADDSNLQSSEGEHVAIYEEGFDDGEGLSTPDDVDQNCDEDDQAEQSLPTPTADDDEDPGLQYYNPHQNPEKRRMIRSSYRALQREVDDNRDELIKPGNNGLQGLLPQSTRIFKKVRMTVDAAADSHLLVTISDLSSKQLKASVEQGNRGVGIDTDQFVSRCIFFMKEGAPPGDEGNVRSSRGPRNAHQDDNEEEGDNGEGLDWAFLGRNACFPSISRPPLSSFLLGPLSVQKRVRAMTRRARSQRQPLGPTTRPQEIKLDEIQRSENSSLTNMVKSVKTRLEQHLIDASQKVELELADLGREPTDDEWSAFCRQHRVGEADQEPAVSLFDFAINPKDFGQTVENLFYISFLIREGAAKVVTDNNGLPLLVDSTPRSVAEQRDQNVEKRQAIFSIDYATWKKLIEAFDIKEPLIPHRVPDEKSISKGGWYG